jgi:hypothetical protein
MFPDHSLTFLETRLLTAATTLELISKEQAFITKFSPTLNSGNDVFSPFVRDNYFKARGPQKGVLGKPVTIQSLNGSILARFNNITEATRSLRGGQRQFIKTV